MPNLNTETGKNVHLKQLMRSGLSLLAIVVVAAFALGLTSPSASASILNIYGFSDQGWALYALDGDLKIENGMVKGAVAAGSSKNDAKIEIKKNSTVMGDVYAYSYKGKLNLKDSAKIQGNVYTDAVAKVEIKDNATYLGTTTSPVIKDNLEVKLENNALLTGDIKPAPGGTNSLLDSLKNQAAMASITAKNLTPNRFVPDNTVKLDHGGTGMLSGGPGETVVLSLKDFKLDDGSQFTLQGTATTMFVINVSKNFELKNNSKLLLSGVLAENVLFNLTGGGNAKIEESEFSGIILGVDRKVEISKNSTLVAEIISKSIDFKDSTIQAASNN